MKPYATDERTKRQSWKQRYKYGDPPPNRGKWGKRITIKKWRSRKGARRLGKVNLEKELLDNLEE